MSRIAFEKGGGFGAVKVMGVYALAQCWESLGRDGCRECLDKAGMRVRRSCRMRKEGRGFNAGCYLRYSTDKFFNHDETGDDRGIYFFYVLSILIKVFIFIGVSCMYWSFLYAGE